MCFDPSAMKMRFLLAALIALAAGGCAVFGDDEPTYETVSPHDARLSFAWPALAGASTRFRKAIRAEEGYRVERGRWEMPAGARAELMVIEALGAKGLTTPDDPKAELINFPDAVRLKAAFGILYQSETAVGPALWRRFVAGDRSCMVFSQRWGGGREGPVRRTFFGYYCAAPGTPFTIQDAQQALKTVSLNAGRAR